MTTETAPRPAPAAAPLPLEAAGADLERRLAAKALASGAVAPRVAVLGAADLLTAEPPGPAARRAEATVHLTADAVLVGPWGGAPEAAACGCCLAIRWQRLRTRTEREALETGLTRTAAGAWPVLPEYTVDAVWSLVQLAGERSGPTNTAPGSRRSSTSPGSSDASRQQDPTAAPNATPSGGRSSTGPGPTDVSRRPDPYAAPNATPGNGRSSVAPSPTDATQRPDPHSAVNNPSRKGRAGLSPAPPTSSPETRPQLPRVTRLDLETGHISTVPLLADPLCPHAPHAAARTVHPHAPHTAAHTAAPTAAPAGPAVLPGVAAPLGEPRRKVAPDQYRLRAPGAYALPFDALANPVCGVLGAGTWSDVTSPTTAPVAGSVFMRGYAGLTDVTWSGQSHSFAGSRDLAFLEGLERYAGTHRRERGGVVTDSYDNLGPAALDPRDCGLYAPETYRADPMLAPFDPARPIPWVRGWSLRDGRPVLVPARLVYYSAGTDADHFVFECSNGCATGSCLEEAVLHGLLELIERDAFLLGWYGAAPLPEIDLRACRSPVLRAMTDRAALCGYDVHAFDNRVDLPVPVVTGLAVRRDGGPGTYAFAAGAAFDPESAVEAAVSEILTYLPHLPRQVAERPAELDAMAEDFGLVRRLPDHAALFGLPRMTEHVRGYLKPPAVRTPGELYAGWEERRPRGLDLGDDVRWLTAELAAAGCDVIVVDQTAPEQRALGLHTVCTLAPGLLPIDFGWARQRALTMPRLRTAQRRAGMRADDLPEAAIRRVPHPFP